MKDALDLRVRRPVKQHPEADWPTWTSESKVIADMCKTSGLQDKAIAIEIDVDNATLSKACSGQARLSERHMQALMDATGSHAWLHYWILRCGYDPRSLRKLESDLEREVRELRERLESVEKEREVEMRLFSKLRATA